MSDEDLDKTLRVRARLDSALYELMNAGAPAADVTLAIEDMIEHRIAMAQRQPPSGGEKQGA